jgi:hypothetical protein
MPGYNPQIVISAAPGITDYLYMVLYEATAPLTPVANSGQLAPPHNASRQLQFINLNPVIHLVKLFVTDGVSTTGTIIANFSIDPRFPGTEIKLPWHIYADTEPGFDSGTVFFSDPDNVLEGWDYTVDIRGMGKLDPDTEVDTTGPGTGYTILIPDYEIQPNEHHIIEFAPKLIVYNAPTNAGGTLFSEVEIIDADRSLVEADKGKQFIIASATSTVVVTLPDITTIAANKLFLFSSEGGNHKNAVIEVEGSNSEKIDWNGQQTQIILGQCEHIWFYKWVDPDDAGIFSWKVCHASDRILQVGEIFYYDRNIDLLNAVFADGSELDRDVYPRLWNYIQSLDASMLVSEATWQSSFTEKGKYSTGDGSTTFRMRILTPAGFIRGVDGTIRKAGSFQAESVGDVTGSIGFPTGDSYTGHPYDPSALGKGLAINAPFTLNKTITITTGGETRPNNIGAYLLIRI